MHGTPAEKMRRLSAAGLSLSALACSQGAGPTGPPAGDPDGPSEAWSHAAIAVPFPVDALRFGALGGASIHCAGPLHRESEYQEYVVAYADLPPAMWVDYYSLVDARFTPAERRAVFESRLAEYGGIPFLGISYTS